MDQYRNLAQQVLEINQDNEDAMDRRSACLAGEVEQRRQAAEQEQQRLVAEADQRRQSEKEQQDWIAAEEKRKAEEAWGQEQAAEEKIRRDASSDIKTITGYKLVY